MHSGDRRVVLYRVCSQRVGNVIHVLAFARPAQQLGNRGCACAFAALSRQSCSDRGRSCTIMLTETLRFGLLIVAEPQASSKLLETNRERPRGSPRDEGPMLTTRMEGGRVRSIKCKRHQRDADRPQIGSRFGATPGTECCREIGH